MKKRFIIFIVFLLGFAKCFAQPGKYIPKHLQRVLYTSFVDADNVPNLPKNFSLFEFSMLNALTDSVNYFLYVYQSFGQKILLLTALEDSDSDKYKVLDIVLVKNVSANQEIKSLLCRKNRKDDPSIIALVKNSETAYFSKIIKAWRANLKSQMFIEIPTNGIDCLNEGFEQY